MKTGAGKLAMTERSPSQVRKTRWILCSPLVPRFDSRCQIDGRFMASSDPKSVFLYACTCRDDLVLKILNRLLAFLQGHRRGFGLPSCFCSSTLQHHLNMTRSGGYRQPMAEAPTGRGVNSGVARLTSSGASQIGTHVMPELPCCQRSTCSTPTYSPARVRRRCPQTRAMAEYDGSGDISTKAHLSLRWMT